MAASKASAIIASTVPEGLALRHLTSREPTWVRAVEEPSKAGEMK